MPRHSKKVTSKSLAALANSYRWRPDEKTRRYLEELSEYREKTKNVRVGRYGN